MKKLFFLLLICTVTVSSAQFNDIVKQAQKITTGQPPTAEEVANGLKEALEKGTSSGTDLVSKADGYFKNPTIKIPFPPDIKRVEDKLRLLGMGSEVDRFVLAMNRGAEDAAKEAKPIFVNAIKAMTIEDAWSILRGQPDAATQYLKRVTSPEIKTKFKPVIQNSLDKVSATKYYADLINTYNKLPFVTKANPDLNEYATSLAMQGLFTMIAVEEKKIRENPGARTTELLKKVFANQK